MRPDVGSGVTGHGAVSDQPEDESDVPERGTASDGAHDGAVGVVGAAQCSAALPRTKLGFIFAPPRLFFIFVRLHTAQSHGST